MRTIAISKIVIRDRQRKEIKPGELEELKKSILSKGLFSPPVIYPDLSIVEEPMMLLAGERRLTAMRQLHEEGHTFKYENEEVPADHMPYVLSTELTELELKEAELEENLLRVNLTWLEESEARKAIHELRLLQNPKQTLTETGKEIAALKGTSPASERLAIATALIISEHKDNPRVKNARTRREAVTAILDESETLFKAKNVATSLKVAMSTNKVIHGDLRTEMPKLPKGSIDTILFDPPYGMNADSMGKGESHYYDDSPEYALELCKFALEDGFRVTKNRALLFMFCDFDHFVTLRDHASRMAWSVWRTPITWIKGTDGHAPWGKAGFIRTTEVLLFATKGQKELLLPGGPDHLNFPRTARGARTHAAEKPAALLKHLVSISTLPGETILDPCAGSGSIIPVAIANNSNFVVIEKDASYHKLCLAKMSGEPDEPESIDDLSLDDYEPMDLLEG